MSITRYFDLYLNAGNSIPLTINVNQYDQGETWIFTLYSDNGVKYTPSAGSIVGIKSDGYVITNAATVNGSGQVVVTETQQMTAAAGKAIYELQIDSLTHGTANFVVLVEPSPTDNGVVSESDLSVIQEALNAVTPAVIEQTINDWMSEYASPATVIYVDGDTLYIATNVSGADEEEY